MFRSPGRGAYSFQTGERVLQTYFTVHIELGDMVQKPIVGGDETGLRFLILYAVGVAVGFALLAGEKILPDRIKQLLLQG
jgi:hypothetical protein